MVRYSSLSSVGHVLIILFAICLHSFDFVSYTENVIFQIWTCPSGGQEHIFIMLKITTLSLPLCTLSLLASMKPVIAHGFSTS